MKQVKIMDSDFISNYRPEERDEQGRDIELCLETLGGHWDSSRVPGQLVGTGTLGGHCNDFLEFSCPKPSK